MLYYTTLYHIPYTILYHTILYYTILYYTILYYAVLWEVSACGKSVLQSLIKQICYPRSEDSL